jgi:hypothetical protein
VVEGIDALRRYWARGLERIPDLHFEVLEVAVGIDAVAIRYGNQAGRVVTEVAHFRHGKVERASAFYVDADLLAAVGSTAPDPTS